MPTYLKCDKLVQSLAEAIIEKHASHTPLALAHVKLDFVFAFSDKDHKTGLPINYALTKNGITFQ